jgi:hypothetical protein
MPEAVWKDFKDTIKQNKKTFRPDQYHYMLLHMVRQGKNEDDQLFADR